MGRKAEISILALFCTNETAEANNTTQPEAKHVTEGITTPKTQMTTGVKMEKHLLAQRTGTVLCAASTLNFAEKLLHRLKCHKHNVRKAIWGQQPPCGAWKP